jgi:hypothetical protein
MPEPILKPEFDYYIAHQQELVAAHLGKFVVIKGGRVIGVFNSDIEAVMETSKNHQLGTFLVQKCEPGAENYTQSFHSRVTFA